MVRPNVFSSSSVSMGTEIQLNYGRRLAPNCLEDCLAVSFKITSHTLQSTAQFEPTGSHTLRYFCPQVESQPTTQWITMIFIFMTRFFGRYAKQPFAPRRRGRSTKKIIMFQDIDDLQPKLATWHLQSVDDLSNSPLHATFAPLSRPVARATDHQPPCSCPHEKSQKGSPLSSKIKSWRHFQDFSRFIGKF